MGGTGGGTGGIAPVASPSVGEFGSGTTNCDGPAGASGVVAASSGCPESCCDSESEVSSGLSVILCPCHVGEKRVCSPVMERIQPQPTSGFVQLGPG